MADDRETLILSLAHKVHSIAYYYLRRCPRNIDKEDFIQAGWLGAIRAVDADDGSGRLAAFAAYKIQGAILDHMRDCDHLHRQHRKDVQGGELAPSHRSLDAFPGWDLADKRSSIAAMECEYDVNTLMSITPLEGRYRAVLKDYYWNEYPMSLIGERMGVTEGRVSQIRTAALAKVRAAAK